MPTFVRHNGTIKEIQDARARKDGSIRQVTEIYARRAGNIELVWRRLQLRLTSVSLFNFNTSGGGFGLFRDGVLSGSATSLATGTWTQIDGQWVEAGATATVGDDFEVRLVQSGSGNDIPDGPVLNVWHPLNSPRIWTWTLPADGVSRAFSGEVSVRDIATSGASLSGTASVTINFSRGII